MIEIDREITQDFERASELEWLDTNGLGGWAGTTVAGAHSRRHHGLLVAATQERRTVLLSRLDETLHVGGESFELSCNQFPGAVAPRGYEHLTAFRKDLFPTFDYEAGGVRLRKTVAAVDGENTTLVLYEVVEAPGPFILSLRPFFAARDLNALTSANPGVSQEAPFADGVLRLRLYPSVPDMPEVFLRVPGAEFRSNPQWWYRFEYEGDRRRGLEFQEDLWTPGVFGLELSAGDRLGIVISTQDPAGRDALALFEKERKRREKIVKAIDQKLGARDDFARYLALAADSFLVRRGPGQRAVIAGYPESEERGRDTMIALPGLCLVTGRHEDAKKILRAFIKSLHLESGSADASLWLFVASWKYLQATGDEVFARDTLLPALRKVVHWHDKRIKAETGGFLASGVEVNALWFNALSILAEFEARLGDPAEAKLLIQRAKRVQKTFQDEIQGDEVPPYPGQIFALSLPFPLLSKPKAARMLAAVTEELCTPAGLLGPWLTALARVHGAAGRKQGLAAIAELKPRLVEAGGAGALEVAEVLRAYVEDLRVGQGKVKKASPVGKAKQNQ
ncbi:MAG TPA: glycogen debranching enzyme N-terminal domain-containing protein [Thermoanaerobaculia bacterium]|jgi:glycogen debranching enzyme|nr:glycogen debranching enzyme N-terminal domain-containing protein [Thermoanaerobaculia bacterium]